MKRFLIITLGLALFSPPLYAQNTQNDTEELARVITNLGVGVYYDSAECKKENIYGFYHLKKKELHICNLGNQTEQLDTFKHEAWHVLQDYTNCIVGDSKAAPLLSTSQIAKPFWEHTYLYSSSMKHLEADATQAAYTLSTKQITEFFILVSKVCSK